MRAGIIGCGMGGMAAAIALSRRGWDVEVFETFAHPGPVGSGLLLQPTGLEALGALGLEDEVRACGAPVGRLQGHDLSGRLVLELDYDAWRPGCRGLGIHRAVLFDVLHAAVVRDGLPVHTATRIVRIANPARPVLHDADGKTHGPFDLVIAADGAGSAARESLRPAARAPQNPWGALWANAAAPDDRFEGALRQVYDRARMMVGVLPIGRGPGGSGPLVSLFWSMKTAQMDRFGAGDFDAWKAAAMRAWPALAPLLDQIEGPHHLSHAVYRDVSVGRWNAGACVLIGDAAHGTSPQLGQGANLAIVDAVELAARLDAGRPVARALGGFSRDRRRHVAWYQLASRWMTPMFQSDSVFWPWLRDRILVRVARTPGLRRIAIATLVGTARFGLGPWRLRR